MPRGSPREVRRRGARLARVLRPQFSTDLGKRDLGGTTV